MLDPDIMPETWKFAQESINYKQHYSGGNGTRMAIFSMFYGLYGNYWFPFLSSQRSPLVIDRLIADGYQMKMFTSARFTYPEFDKTVFSAIPPECLVQSTDSAGGKQGWQLDDKYTGELIDFIKNRDTSRPFMTFMFFESPHARYYFPPENAIRKPYLEEFNYATVNLDRDIDLIKNRYINSCNHLDGQFARIINYLKEANLMDSTVILMTGDHGEEFMEHGHWGHNESFVNQQIHTPMILHVPGEPSRVVEHMTDHLDIPGAILGLMGVENPVEDYSLGGDIFTDTESQPYYVLASWNELCYVDNEYKARFSLKSYNMASMKVTTEDDKPVSREEFFQNRKEQVLDMMHKIKRFSR